jgi:hypothetical protein
MDSLPENGGSFQKINLANRMYLSSGRELKPEVMGIIRASKGGKNLWKSKVLFASWRKGCYQFYIV